MRLIDAEEAERLYAPHGAGAQVSGGSAGNTAAGLAALGGRAGFIGQVAPDQLGEFYRARPHRRGVEFITPRERRRRPTARSMILVTPDGHRTMNTFLGAAQHLPASALDEEQIARASILYLEGYLWDPETPRYAMVRAIEVAARSRPQSRLHPVRHVLRRPPPRRLQRAARRAADRHSVRQPGRGRGACRRRAPRDARSQRSSGKVETLVVTRSEDGALATRGSERADVSGRADRRSWSTPPAPATCSPPASCSAKRAGRASSSRCGSARSAPPR